MRPIDHALKYSDRSISRYDWSPSPPLAAKLGPGGRSGSFANVLGRPAAREAGAEEDSPADGSSDRSDKRSTESPAAEDRPATPGSSAGEREITTITVAELRAASADPLGVEAPRAVAAVANLDAMAQQMLRAVSVRQANGVSTVRMELHAEQLKGVQLEISLEAGGLRARFGAADEASYRLLSAATAELQQALVSRGLRVDAIEVRPTRADEQPADGRRQRRERPPADPDEQERRPARRKTAGFVI